MGAIAQIFCPRNEKPLNDFENETIRAQEGLNSVRTIVSSLFPQSNTTPINIDVPLSILKAQMDKVTTMKDEVLTEISKIDKKTICGTSVDSGRFYRILLTGGDSLLSISGVAMLAVGDSTTKIAGTALALFGQGLSKLNDFVSQRKEAELNRKASLEEYLATAQGMETAILTLQNCLQFVSRLPPTIGHAREPTCLAGNDIEGSQKKATCDVPPRTVKSRRGGTGQEIFDARQFIRQQVSHSFHPIENRRKKNSAPASCSFYDNPIWEKV